MGQVIFIIWRESVEALLVVGILYSWLSRTPGAASGRRWLWGGVVLGLLLAGLLALGIYSAQELLLDWQDQFQALMVLVAAALVTGVEQLQALEWLPPLVDGVWDSTWLLSDMGRVGGLVAALTGYRAQPSLMTVLAWLAFWILMAWLMRRSSARISCPTAQPGPA